jgi:DNA transposition AAA+ family ATPase
MNLNPGKLEFSDADHAEIREAVEALKRDGLKEAQIAREAELGASTLNSYLKGNYNGRNDGVAIALHRWLESRREATAARLQLPKSPTYQPLGTSKIIRSRMDYAKLMGRLVVITGVPGCSKTSTARQYRADHPRVYLATMDAATSSLPAMLTEILAAMGIEVTGGLPQQLARKVVAKATESDTGCLIIVDEGQHLSTKAIEQLRAINDRTEQLGIPVGIVVMGNEELGAKIGPTAARAVFAQVSSRVAQRRYISGVPRDDVVALAHAWAGANAEELGGGEIEFLVSIAQKPGGLRNVKMTFEGALIAVRGAETPTPLTLKHLQGAFASITDLGRVAA